VSDLQAGWVEWLAAGGTKGKTKATGLRLVHCRSASPKCRQPRGCQYDPQDEFRTNRGIVEGLPLDRFTGPDSVRDPGRSEVGKVHTFSRGG